MRASGAAVIGLLACAPLALAACVDVAYSDGGGGATGASTTSAGGASGLGGATTIATSTSSGGGSASGGGGGAAPCIPTAEICNGLDDDCDGLADQPTGQVPGNFCGCDWTFDASVGGRAYALCPKGGQSLDAFTCPIGTRKLVLQSTTEQAYVSAWLNGLLAPDSGAYIGLRQTPGSTVGSGWAWLTSPGDPPGRVLQWNGGQPDDRDLLEPTLVEDGDQDCATLFRLGPNMPSLHDLNCTDSASVVVCEEASPQPCVTGGSCLLALGCAGVFDCGQPAGSECVPAPAFETCNGRDDDCDGQVDASGTHACGCVLQTNSATNRKYKFCSTNRQFQQAECGPGYKLAVIGDAAEQAYVVSMMGGGQYLIGLYQLDNALTPDAGWFWVDGSSLGFTAWGPGEPNDSGGAENAVENCTSVVSNAWNDIGCNQQHPYVCEEL